MGRPRKYHTDEERLKAKRETKLRWHHSPKGKAKVMETMSKNPVFILLSHLKEGKCPLCHYKKSKRAIKFHHINPSEKLFNICTRSTLFRPLPKVIAELNKCIMVCGNCHDEIHDKLIAPAVIEFFRLKVTE